jgi:hypothetical protein
MTARPFERTMRRPNSKRPLSTALTYVSISNAGLVKTKARVSQRLVHNEGFHEALGRVPKGSRQATDDLEAE